MSRKITNDCFIFNGFRQVCVLCEIMMMMMVDRCYYLFVGCWLLIIVIDFVRCECEQGLTCEFSAVLEKSTFSSTTMYVPIAASLLHGDKYNRDS